jgi:hypothetical protein
MPYLSNSCDVRVDDLLDLLRYYTMESSGRYYLIFFIEHPVCSVSRPSAVAEALPSYILNSDPIFVEIYSYVVGVAPFALHDSLLIANAELFW